MLQLKVLPKESGYLGIIGVSAQRVAVDGKPLAVQSQNYYMLTEQLPINYLHRLVPDDTQPPVGFTGGLYGYDDAPQRLTWKSTEQNIDVYAFFSLLGRQSGLAVWAARAATARTFIASTNPENVTGFVMKEFTPSW